MTGMPWLVAGAVLAAILGLLLMRLGRGMRQRRGLGGGNTVSLDRVTLTSRRYGLTSRPDRLIRQGGTIIPEEWKSARTARPGHRAQMGMDPVRGSLGLCLMGSDYGTRGTQRPKTGYKAVAKSISPTTRPRALARSNFSRSRSNFSR